MFNQRITLILVALLALLMLSSCSKNSGSEKNSINSLPESGNDKSLDERPSDGAGLLGEQSALKSLSDDSIKEAHTFLPQYPGAVLDQEKGSVNKSDFGNDFNLVYHTDDPVNKVADFFRKNIAEQYLKENSSPEGDDWVHFEYNVEGVRQSGSLFIRKTEEGNTEIIYTVSISGKNE